MGVASSLREVAESVLIELREQGDGQGLPRFDDDVSFRISYGASSMLARQLEMGAPIDLLVSADSSLIERGVKIGVLSREGMTDLARGRLVLVGQSIFAEADAVPEGAALLDDPRLNRIGLPGQAVPLGRYGRAWLQGNGRLGGLMGKIVETENARANLSAFASGHVDAAFLYASDLRHLSRPYVVSELARGTYPSIHYQAALAEATAHCPGPQHALRAWQSAAAKAAFQREGFDITP